MAHPPTHSPRSQAAAPSSAGWLVLARRLQEGVVLESQSPEGRGSGASITVLRTAPLVLELCLPGFGGPVQLSLDAGTDRVKVGVRADRSVRIVRSELASCQ